MKTPPDTFLPGWDPGALWGGDLSLSELFLPLASQVPWALERTENALKVLGDPHLSYPTLHVGGTNGKGSVAAVWARILLAQGFRVGLYTSPHLCSFRERFQLAGVPVSREILLEAAAEVREVIHEAGLTFFEAATVLAFHLFRRVDVEVAVVEVGMGGRLDATNVIRPEVVALTNVALDHAEYLGYTLEAIATEKAGIIKTGVPVVTAERDSALVQLFRSRADSLGSPFEALSVADDIQDLEISPGGNRFRMLTRAWGTLEVMTPLAGRHQAVNVALAVRALEHLPAGIRPGREAVLQGCRTVRWPGRLQIQRGPGVTWVFDVAHNPAGVRALVDSLGRVALPSPLVLLVGIQGDKDWRSMLPPLFALAREAVLAQPPSVPPARRWDPLEAAGAVKTPRPNLHILQDFSEALETARRLAGNGTVLVTGSHHTVGDVMSLLGMRPFPETP